MLFKEQKFFLAFMAVKSDAVKKEQNKFTRVN